MKKQCNKCRERKSLDQFGKDAAAKDGKRNQCKVCDKLYRQREDVRLRKLAYDTMNSDRKKAYQQSYSQRPEVKVKAIARRQTADDRMRRAEYRRRQDVRERARKRERRDDVREYRRAYKSQEDVKLHALFVRRNRSYGFSRELFDISFKLQRGLCAICQRPLDHHSRHTHADHCHRTATPRGILCQRCNLGIGHFSDDPILLRAAADYLEDPPLSLIV